MAPTTAHVPRRGSVVSPSAVTMRGPVKKRGGSWRSLKQRYFVLSGNRIEYLVSEDGTKQGEVLLAPSSVVEVVGKRGFNVRSLGGRLFECEVDDTATRDAWVAAIARAIADTTTAYRKFSVDGHRHSRSNTMDTGECVAPPGVVDWCAIAVVATVHVGMCCR